MKSYYLNRSKNFNGELISYQNIIHILSKSLKKMVMIEMNNFIKLLF